MSGGVHWRRIKAQEAQGQEFDAREVAGELALAIGVNVVVGAVTAFVAANPQVSVSAIIAVARAIRAKRDPVKAGVAAGLESFGIQKLMEWIHNGCR